MLAVLTPAVAQTTRPALEKINLRLVWKHQFQFAGYYMAKEKGFYAQRNLDVTIAELNPVNNNLQAVLSGRADFAVGRSSLLIDKIKGHDIVALFAAFQHSPFMLLTKAFTGIQQPADLAGKRIMIEAETENMGELVSMLVKAGLNKDDYLRQNHSYNIDDLINDHTDAMASYVSNEPYKLIQQGIAYNILHPADYGFEMYSDILYTSGKLLRENPHQVERFYQASIEGWQYAFTNIAETVAVIHRKYNSQNRSREALLFEAQELKRLAFDENKIFGRLLPHRFREMAQVYLLTGAIDQVPGLEDFVYRPPMDSLQLTFEELAYIKNKKSVRLCVQQNWPPYEQIVEQKYQGLVSDFIHLIRDKSGLSIKTVQTESSQQAITLTRQGLCDLTSVASRPQSGDALSASYPYLNIPLTQVSRDAIEPSKILSGRIGLSTEAPYYEDVLHDYPQIQVIDVGSVLNGLKMLQQGRLDSLIASLAHIRYLMSRHDINNLLINEQAHINWNPGFLINAQQPLLGSILNKSIELISKQDHDRIMSRWVVPLPGGSISVTTFWVLMASAFIIVLFVMYRHFKALIRSRILQELADTDQLTGIANRRKTLNAIENFCQMANRYGYNFSLIFFDIDDFKEINDEYGHAVGDRVLCQLSELVNRQTRKTDTFGRWGGEEFILACPHADLAETEQKARLIQKKLSTFNFKLARPVSCSFGITEYLKHESVDDFIRRADRAMYQAKQSGKDCIHSIEKE
ncbi:MAG: ABC transporter substrate-binding protein [Gammaproteobacteria bacterium]|nr:ABC transporter substrate-binding protein [Gammaproteobacteria bacterium]